MGPWRSGLSAMVSASQISIFSVASSCRKPWIVPEIEYQHDTNTVGGVEITRGVGVGVGARAKGADREVVGGDGSGCCFLGGLLSCFPSGFSVGEGLDRPDAGGMRLAFAFA